MITITILIIAFVIFSVGVFFRPKWMGFPEQMNGTINGRTSQMDDNRVGLSSDSEVPDFRTRCVEQYLASRASSSPQSTAVPQTLPWSFRALIWFERSIPWIVGFILLFASMLFITDLAHGQSTTFIQIYPSSGPTLIANKVGWTGSGPGSINNAYFFTPFTSTTTTCVYVVNNDAVNSHTVTANLFATYDPTYTPPTTTVGSQPVGTFTLSSVAFVTTLSSGLAANSSVAGPLNVQGASFVFIEFSAGTGGTGTVSVAISQVNNPGGCSNSIPSGTIVQGPTLAGSADVNSAPVQIGGIDASNNVQKVQIETNTRALFVMGSKATNITLASVNPLFIGCQTGTSATIATRGNFINCDTSGNLQTITRNTAGTDDPCKNPNIIPQSVAISLSAAATTQLVAPSGSTQVYVCGFDFTISEVVTTANTLQFITGTGATCGGSTVTKTGLYGAGGVTAGIPIHIQSGGNGSVFTSAASSGVCVVTAIGATGSFAGIMTFVQQ